MKDSNIAKAYARSIIALGKENNINVADELVKFNEVINESNDLENVLFLEVFTIEEKTAVLGDIVGKLSLSALTKNLLSFLVDEKRLSLFPSIFKEVMVIDDHERGFLRGSIEGSVDQISEADKAKLVSYIEEKLGKKTELEYRKSTNVTAGYRVTVEDLQLDATVDNQLEQFKNTVTGLN